MLELAPGARWAFDRVKVVLGAQGRWDELFGLFDRTIDATADEGRRGDLLYEAAFAAKDLAHLPERAIGYLESAYALRANDATVENALERLYERQGRRVELVGLLTKQLNQGSGFQRRDIRRKIASLWLELGEAEQAGVVLDESLEAGDAVIAEVVDLLERLLAQPVAARRRERAIHLLLGHYERFGRIDDAVRIGEQAVAIATEIHGDGPSKHRALVHHRLARALVRATRLDDALAQLRSAIQMHPGHLSILHDLAHVALDLGQIDLSEETYRTLLLAAPGPTDDGTGAPSARADALLDLGEIALRKGDAVRAAELVDSALREAISSDGDSGRLEQRLRTRGRHDLLSRALERRVETAAALADRAVALRELNELWAGQLGRPRELGTRIRGYAERIAGDLDREGVTDGSAWTALAAVYSTFGDGGEGLDTSRIALLVEAALPKARPGAERSGLRVILAKILLEQATRLDEVIAVLSSAVDEDPAGTETTAAAAATWEAAAGAYRKLLLVSERESSREELARIAVATADACARAGGPGGAREALGRVADVLSQSAEWAPELERLCLAMGDWKRFASLLTTQAEQEGNVERKTDLLLRAGRLLLEAPSDPTGALRVIELARASRPNSDEALVLWARAQVAVGQVQPALAVLYDAAQRSGGTRSPLLAEIYLEIGRAHLARDEIVEAFGALELGFGVDPGARDLAMLLGQVALDIDETETAQRAFLGLVQPPLRPSGVALVGITSGLRFG